MYALKIDWLSPEQLISVLTGLISRGLYDLAKQIMSKFKRPKPIQINQHQARSRKFDIEKFRLLTNIDFLHQIPKFDIEDPTMNKELVNLHYILTIEYLSKFEIENDHRLRYLSGNHGITANSRLDLIEQLEAERKSPRRNGSRYCLGFRTLSCILSDNIDQITVDELKELTYRLKPFFLNYSRKDFLNHYATFDNN